ncbi:ZIP family metal transporter [Candidatus Woesearchaeota archaeon]|nr:ZIP family metal transporter [Candidatus Woesearchaeota archaeon]
MLLYIIIATILVSLVSFVGVLVSSKGIKRFLHYFISFAAGALLAVSFLDLIPHAAEEIGEFHDAAPFVLGGILLFFLVERFIHWHHCGHDHGDCDQKPAGMLILTGDFVHNFLDGVLIAGAFLLDVRTGIATTLIVLLHEIPQEFGDFAVLIHSGYSRLRALKLNFLSALSAVLGGIIGFIAFDLAESIVPFAVLVAAGGFIYVALSDIVPSMHKHKQHHATVWKETAIFVLTMVAFYFFIGALHGMH